MSKRGPQRELAKNRTSYSEMLGYSDAMHFARAFRRIAGIAPHLYRRQFTH